MQCRYNESGAAVYKKSAVAVESAALTFLSRAARSKIHCQSLIAQLASLTHLLRQQGMVGLFGVGWLDTMIMARKGNYICISTALRARCLAGSLFEPPASVLERIRATYKLVG